MDPIRDKNVKWNNVSFLDILSLGHRGTRRQQEAPRRPKVTWEVKVDKTTMFDTLLARDHTNRLDETSAGVTKYRNLHGS